MGQITSATTFWHRTRFAASSARYCRKSRRPLPAGASIISSSPSDRRPRRSHLAGLKSKYPEQMTIVIQHQFWEMKVTESSFEIGLSFSDVPEKLFILFNAIRGLLIRRSISNSTRRAARR